MEIKKVGVIGAGVMGSGIAAHMANAGVPVVLLDIVPEGANDRNTLAAGAVSRMLKTEPAPFMHKRNARLVSVGNLEDDLGALSDCDWIVEAVIERLDIKRELYSRLDSVRKAGSVVSSNTSTIPLEELVSEMPGSFRRDFMITHFFNPPRYMRLLEVVEGPDTRSDASLAIRRFCDRALGKGVVACKDTPGFIGNRVGVYWLQCAVAEAIAMGISVEEADAVVGSPMGIPRTGVFGLLDLVGLDLMPHVLASMDQSLAKGDAFRQYMETPQLLHAMIADGYIGRKGKGGFYRLRRTDGARVKEAIDLNTGEYRESQRPRLDSVKAARDGGLRALVEHEDPGGRYAWRVLARTLGYAASLVPEIADDIVAVDAALRLGFNWRYGPFELIDLLGAGWFAQRLEADGEPVPDLLRTAAAEGFYRQHEGALQYLGTDGVHRNVPRPEGVQLLSDVKRAGEPVAGNGSASLWDVGDEVLCLEFHSKMNAMDPDILAMARKALEIVPGRFKALVIYNEAENFCVGVRLDLALFAANTAAWDQIEQMVEAGQRTYAALKYAPFPVIGAPAGMALGGGCEILLHCDAVAAHAETYMGLVETGVGLIPGWGGCKEMLGRWCSNPARPGGPMPPVSRVFETVSMASVSRSAQEARDYLFLRPSDVIVMNRDRVLATAKCLALDMAAKYSPPEAVEMSLPGPAGYAALSMAVDGFVKLGKATAHDQVVAHALARVLSGGDTDATQSVDEEQIMALERQQFMTLIRHPKTLERVEHTLETGKPLRN